MEYEARRKMELETAHADATARMLAAQKEVGVRGTFAAAMAKHSEFVLWMFVTLWISQVGTWGFLMMTFKKDVFPR
jgi:hypothetical protein